MKTLLLGMLHFGPSFDRGPRDAVHASLVDMTINERWTSIWAHAQNTIESSRDVAHIYSRLVVLASSFIGGQKMEHKVHASLPFIMKVIPELGSAKPGDHAAEICLYMGGAVMGHGAMHDKDEEIYDDISLASLENTRLFADTFLQPGA